VQDDETARRRLCAARPAQLAEYECACERGRAENTGDQLRCRHRHHHLSVPISPGSIRADMRPTSARSRGPHLERPTIAGHSATSRARHGCCKRLAPAATRQFWHRALLRAAFDGHEGAHSRSPPMLVKVIARS
jgi:hypothetical protein